MNTNSKVKAQVVKLFICVVAALTLSIVFWAIFIARMPQPEPEPPQLYTLIQTEIVTVQREGTRTIIIENETARVLSFQLTTTQYRRNTAPQQQTRTHLESDILRIYSRGAIMIIYEIATQAIHIL